MTTHGTFPIDSVPAPADCELIAMDAANARRKFQPFVAVNKHGRLVTIIGKAQFGCYRDRFGFLHLPGEIDRDLDAYAERMRAESQDHYETERCIDGRDESFDPNLDAFV